MKKVIRYILLLLTVLLILSSVISCNKGEEPVNGEPSESEDPSDTSNGGDSTNTDGGEGSAQVYRYALAEFSVVRPRSTNTAVNDAVSRLYEYLDALGNGEPTLTDDYGLSADASRKEILVGLTNQPESEEAKKLLSHEMEYAIVFHENKIVVTATTELALSDAMDALFYGYLDEAEDGILEVEAGLSVVEKADVQEVSLYKNGELRYNIVLPSNAGKADEEIAARLTNQIENYTGALAETIYATKTNYRKSTYSILIGDVGYPECEQAYMGLGQSEYAVRVVGNKIVLAGHFSMTREYACELLIQEMNKSMNTEKKTMTLYVPDYWQGAEDRFFFDFPQFTDGREELFIDNENQTLMLGYVQVTASEFAAYCQKLVSVGYVLWQKNEIGENLFRTYRNGEKELCLSYYPSEDNGTMHLFADEHKETARIPDAASDYEKVREMTLYNISFDYSQKSIEDGYGMCYVIALEDGRYVIMDGGHNASSGSRADDRLYQCLAENNEHPSGRIVIAAWFMSHPHGDHHGAFESFVSKYGKDVTLECFVANPYSEKMNTEGSWFTYTMPRLLLQMNAPLVKPHTGQILTFCNTKFEVVFTHENLYPKTNFGANNASTVLRMYQNGHTALFTADASGAASELMIELYGDTLKSDIFQVNHHGHSGGRWELYDAATYEDSYVLWTCPEEYFYYRTLGEFIEGKSSISTGVLKPNRDLALKVGFDRNFYAEGIVEEFTFPTDGKVTVSEERDHTKDPKTYSLP